MRTFKRLTAGKPRLLGFDLSVGDDIRDFLARVAATVGINVLLAANRIQKSSRRVRHLRTTVKDSNFLIRCLLTTSGSGFRASRYEESLGKGAFQSRANFCDPLLDTNRQTRECSAFFRIPFDIKTFDDFLRRRVDSPARKRDTGPLPKCHFSAKGSFQTAQNSRTLCFTGGPKSELTHQIWTVLSDERTLLGKSESIAHVNRLHLAPRWCDFPVAGR